MSDYALRVQQLSKQYGNQLKALQAVSLTVKQGDFFALLGTNGAGKTTMIGIICGLLNASSGDVEVFGINQKQQPNKVKNMVGLMPQEFNFNGFEPIQEILINQAGYYGIDKTNAMPRIKTLLKQMQLWHKRSEPAMDLSGGMKRRLMLARALVHEPKLLILDEPTAGVDVEIRRSMWQFLETLNKNGTTIILTTHYLEEAENLCHNIALLNKGVITEQLPMKTLLNKITTQCLVLHSREPLPHDINLAHLTYRRIDDITLEVELPNQTSLNELFALLSTQGVTINHLNNKRNRLEALFE